MTTRAPSRRHSRRGVLAAAAITALLLAACSSGTTSGGSKAPFVLGVGLPLSGNNAQYGLASQVADDAARDYINAHGAMNGHKLSLDFWDTAAEPATGVAGTQKFITSKVNAVVGYFNSDVTIPAARLLGKANIPLFGDNPSSPALATMGLKNFTRVTGNDKNEGLVQADFVWKQLHLKTAVVIDDNEAFGQAFGQAFTAEFTKLGGKVVKHISADGSVTDYGSIVAQIAPLKADILNYAGFNPGAALLIKQARAAGITSTYVTDSSQYGTDFINIAGRASLGAYMTNSPTAQGAQSALSAVLQKALTSRKIELTPIPSTAFDTVLDVWHAAQDAHSIAPADLIKVMHSVSFLGVTGRVSFLPDGDRAQIRYTVVKVNPSKKYDVVYHYSSTLH